MTDGLVGHTGFVGGNLKAAHRFAGLFNRDNAADLAGAAFDRLVVSAVPATMWLANNDPGADRANILALFEHLRRAKAGVLVLVSTIAVYRDPAAAPDEASGDYETALAYGRHRREFEALVADAFPRHLILRLPALFGPGLRKNFLYDLMNPVPSFLNAEMFARLRDACGPADHAVLAAAFEWDGGAAMWRFARERFAEGPEAERIGALCRGAGISALAFTNADSRFQFYDLSRLWTDIGRALEAGLPVLNLATEPLTAGEVHAHLTGRPMLHRTAGLVRQDMRTRHGEVWGRSDGYLAGRDEVLAAIRDFVGPRA